MVTGRSDEEISIRVLTHLGLAYAVNSATRHYYLLPEGVVSGMGSFPAITAGRSP
jgi:hypothetical protein